MFGSVKLFGLIGAGLAAGALTLVGVGGQGGPPACSYPSQDALDPWSNAAAVVSYAQANANLFEKLEHPYSDKRRLTKKRADGSFVLDVEAEVRPFKCAYDYKKSELNAGRLIARLEATGDYDPKSKGAKLQAGVSYVWIQQRPGGLRAAIITTSYNMKDMPVTYKKKPRGRVEKRTFSEARWLFDPADDHLWMSCAQLGCCTLDTF